MYLYHMFLYYVNVYVFDKTTGLYTVRQSLSYINKWVEPNNFPCIAVLSCEVAFQKMKTEIQSRKDKIRTDSSGNSNYASSH